MPQTHDTPELSLHVGPLRLYVHPVFVHRQKWPDPRMAAVRQPLLERATTAEDEEPWRTGHGWALRLPWTRWGAVLGYWDMPDPSRTESVLWSSDNGGMIPGVTYQEIKEWPGPEPDPDAAADGAVEVEENVFLIDGERVVLVDYPQGELVEDQLEGLGGHPGLLEGAGDAASDVAEVPAE